VHLGVPTEPGLQAGDIRAFSVRFLFPFLCADALAQNSVTTRARVSRVVHAVVTHRWTACTGLIGLAMAAACGGPALTPSPAPTPTPLPDAPAPPVRVVARVSLPSRIAGTWQVNTVARITATETRPADSRPSVTVRTDPRGESRGDLRAEQRIESRALVSWSMDRTPIGALRATGQVDSFTVRSTLDNPESPTRPAFALLLLDAMLDSVSARVVTRPLLANECDRPELGAVALAKDLLIRIPDGVAVGDRWRDSTVSLVCRTGVPITVHTSTQYQLERLDDNRAIVVRTSAATLEGKGGSAFRALELSGTSTGTQRADVRRATGVLEKLEGTSTLTLQVSERSPAGVPRVQQVVQRIELKAERVAR